MVLVYFTLKCAHVLPFAVFRPGLVTHTTMSLIIVLIRAQDGSHGSGEVHFILNNSPEVSILR